MQRLFIVFFCQRNSCVLVNYQFYLSNIAIVLKIYVYLRMFSSWLCNFITGAKRVGNSRIRKSSWLRKKCSDAGDEGAAGGRGKKQRVQGGEVGGAQWQVRPALCLRNAPTHYCVTKYSDDMQPICTFIYFNCSVDRT